MRRAVDGFLLAALFTLTFAKLRWDVGPVTITVGEVFASLFIGAFALLRIRDRDWRLPRTVQVLAVFFALFLLVYLLGYFNLSSIAARNLYVKGMVTFAVHFVFLMAAVAHLVRRMTPFLWRALAWFCAGLAVNAVYALLSLAYAESTGGELDAVVIEPITGEARGIQLFGVTGGLAIYRSNGLALDPNHLGIMLLVPLLLLLPLYLKLPRGSRLRIPLAALLVLLLLTDLATLSRRALLGLGVGLLVLAVPYRRLLVSARFLVPLGVLAGLLAIIIAQRSNFFESILRIRTNAESSSTRTHFELYDLLGPVLSETPFFGLGKNTFAVYYEFLTGKSDWGPHSYYISVVTETGLVGAVLVAAYLVYVFQRLAVARGLGRSLGAAGDATAGQLQALAWGITAAVVGTMVANFFYLTMQMYYFTGLVVLALTVPLLLARRARPLQPPAT